MRVSGPMHYRLSELRNVSSDVGLPDEDPLRDEGALLEAQLLAVDLTTVDGTAALLFDLRTSISQRHGNVGVIFVHRLFAFAWDAEPRKSVQTAWNVVEWSPRVDPTVSLRASFEPSAHLAIGGDEAEFWLCEVDLPAAPPEYGPDSDRWESGFPTMESSGSVVGMSRVIWAR